MPGFTRTGASVTTQEEINAMNALAGEGGNIDPNYRPAPAVSLQAQQEAAALQAQLAAQATAQNRSNRGIFGRNSRNTGTPLTTEAQPASSAFDANSVTGARWSPDGTHLIFDTPQGKKYFAPFTGEEQFNNFTQYTTGHTGGIETPGIHAQIGTAKQGVDIGDLKGILDKFGVDYPKTSTWRGTASGLSNIGALSDQPFKTEVTAAMPKESFIKDSLAAFASGPGVVIGAGMGISSLAGMALGAGAAGAAGAGGALAGEGLATAGALEASIAAGQAGAVGAGGVLGSAGTALTGAGALSGVGALEGLGGVGGSGLTEAQMAQLVADAQSEIATGAVGNVGVSGAGTGGGLTLADIANIPTGGAGTVTGNIPITNGVPSFGVDPVNGIIPTGSTGTTGLGGVGGSGLTQAEMAELVAQAQGEIATGAVGNVGVGTAGTSTGGLTLADIANIPTPQIAPSTPATPSMPPAIPEIGSVNAIPGQVTAGSGINNAVTLGLPGTSGGGSLLDLLNSLPTTPPNVPSTPSMPPAVPELPATNAIPGQVTATSGLENAVTQGLPGTSGTVGVLPTLPSVPSTPTMPPADTSGTNTNMTEGTIPGNTGVGTGTATTAGSALSRIIDGTATAADWLSVIGNAAPGVISAIGNSQSANALTGIANQQFARDDARYADLVRRENERFGLLKTREDEAIARQRGDITYGRTVTQPSRDRFESSFAPGFTMENDPGYTDALNQSAQGVLRGLSVNGNPAGNPTAWDSALQQIYTKNAYPALQGYRATNAATGGFGSFAGSGATVPGIGSSLPGSATAGSNVNTSGGLSALTGAAGADQNIWGNLGSAFGNVMNPQQSQNNNYLSQLARLFLP